MTDRMTPQQLADLAQSDSARPQNPNAALLAAIEAEHIAWLRFSAFQQANIAHLNQEELRVQRESYCLAEADWMRSSNLRAVEQERYARPQGEKS